MSCSVAGTVSYSNSKWIAASLPTQYVISNTKWPENDFDQVETISSVADSNGFAQITLSTSFETYAEREYIKISSSSVAAYDGVWQIIDAVSPTVFVIDAAFSATATGSFQRYYNNYHMKINVYTGIPATHPLTANRPMALRGNMSVPVNADNEAIIDISSYVQSDLSPFENKLCEILPNPGWIGNDWRMWTAFYIEYAESYDVSDGIEVTTFVSEYVEDQDTDGNTNYYYAANAVHQFQHFQGKSMGEYAIQDTDPEFVPAKFMTDFDEPLYFEDWEYDVSVLAADTASMPAGYTIDYTLVQYDALGNQLATDTQSMGYDDAGVYRFAFSCYTFNASTDYFTLIIKDTTNTIDLTETKTFFINRDCSFSPIYLRWLNTHCNWEGWLFRQKKRFNVDIQGRTLTRRNIFSDWDTTFRTGDTMDDYIATEAYREVEIQTGRLTEDQVKQLRWIRLSNKVFEIAPDTSVECGDFKQTTVLILPDSFTWRSDNNRFYTLSFTMRYTDQILVQNQ